MRCYRNHALAEPLPPATEEGLAHAIPRQLIHTPRHLRRRGTPLRLSRSATYNPASTPDIESAIDRDILAHYIIFIARLSARARTRENATRRVLDYGRVGHVIGA